MNTATTDNLDGLVEWDAPFRITAGMLTLASDVYAPEVLNDENHDIYIEADGWTAFTGYTGQWSYSGAVMHPSEYIGGRLADAILEMAAEDSRTVFALVEVRDESGEYPDGDPIGWAVLYR